MGLMGLSFVYNDLIFTDYDSCLRFFFMEQLLDDESTLKTKSLNE